MKERNLLAERFGRRGDGFGTGRERMKPVFDKKSHHVHDFDLDQLASADSAAEAKRLVNHAQKKSGTRPLVKRMVLDTHKSGREGYFVHPDDKAWYE